MQRADQGTMRKEMAANRKKLQKQNYNTEPRFHNTAS